MTEDQSGQEVTTEFEAQSAQGAGAPAWVPQPVEPVAASAADEPAPVSPELADEAAAMPAAEAAEPAAERPAEPASEPVVEETPEPVPQATPGPPVITPELATSGPEPVPVTPPPPSVAPAPASLSWEPSTPLTDDGGSSTSSGRPELVLAAAFAAGLLLALILKRLGR